MDLEKLCQLSRIEIPDEEKETLRKDMDSILGYVSEIKNLSAQTGAHGEMLTNVMREDGEADEAGKYTADIVAEMPRSKKNFLLVKKIIEK
jgi:aspartyl/glutamyl-tRNA(Asn/Gln) amidotransferase C subunit